MATPQEEAIIIQLALEKKKFEQDVATAAAEVKKYAAQMKADFATVGNALKISRPQDAAAINTAVKGLESQAKAASNVAEEVKKIPKAINEIPAAAEKAHGAFSRMTNVVKGAITAMLTLAALRAVTKFFTGAIKAAQDFRAQLLLLNFSEAILSQKGMDITRAELDKFVTDVETKFKYLSKLQAMTIVSETAGATQEFGISKEQLGDLTQAIAFIQLKNKMLGREDVDAAHIINAAMDARSNFFNGMGINITKSIVEQKAYNMGLAKWGEELSKDARFQAILALLVEQTSSKQAELNKQLEGTPLGNQMKFSKEWADTMLEAGNALLSVKDNLLDLWATINSDGDAKESIVTFFENITEDVNDFIDAIQNYITVMDTFNKTVDALDGKTGKKDGGLLGRLLFGGLAGDFLQSLVVALGTILATYLAFMTTLSLELQAGFGLDAWKDAGANAFQAWKEGWEKAKRVLAGEQGLFEPNPTEKRKYKEAGFSAGEKGEPTGIAATKIDEEAQKMKEALDKLNEDILQAELKLKQDMQDVAIDLGQKMVDITLEYKTKRAELAIDYANKIADINRNYAQKIEDINISQHESQEQSRQDELQREREFQEKMLQLKEEFLMDLDDALHSRDARQILKLIKRYNLDKLQAEREHELAEQAAKEEERIKQESFERQRKAAQEARDRALEDARIDYERKLEELARQEKAEVEAAVLAANRKLADLEKENLDRNILIAAGLANDFATTATWLGMIDQLFTDHYGYVTGVYGAMMSMLSQPITMGSVSQSQGQLPPAGMIGGTENPGIGGYQTPTSDSSSASLMLSRGLGFDKGLSSLKQNGKDRSSMFSSMQGGGNGADGKVSIELLLSPDLESRITRNTLNKTAEVVARTGRSK